MRVSGKVVDKETGKGVGKILVVIFEVKNEQPTKKLDFVETNFDGKYIFNLVPPGEYWLIAQPADNSSYALELKPKKVKVLRGKNVVNVDFHLEQSGTISGVVYEADGITIVKNARVHAQLNDLSGAGISETDENGKYLITNLKQGNYTVSAFPNGHISKIVQNVPVISNQPTQNINFFLNPDMGTKINGTIRSKATGEPITNAFVSISGEDKDETGLMQTNNTGFYKISGLTGGKYALKVIAQGYKQFAQKDIVIQTGEQINTNVQLESSPVPTQSSWFNSNHANINYALLNPNKTDGQSVFAAGVESYESCLKLCRKAAALLGLTMAFAVTAALALDPAVVLAPSALALGFLIVAVGIFVSAELLYCRPYCKKCTADPASCLAPLIYKLY